MSSKPRSLACASLGGGFSHIYLIIYPRSFFEKNLYLELYLYLFQLTPFGCCCKREISNQYNELKHTASPLAIIFSNKTNYKYIKLLYTLNLV